MKNTHSVAAIPNSALLLTDLQPDFMPGGPLPVTDGDNLVEPIRELTLTGRFSVIIATQDWHPPGHVSFASSHQGLKPFDVISLYGYYQTLWPDHCVQNTPGAELHPRLPGHLISAIIRKGNDPDCDSYSSFRNNWNARGDRPRTGLTGFLRERGIESVYLCGLARDFCVLWSAEDAAESGFQTTVLWDLSLPVNPSSDEQVKSDLAARGVRIALSSSL
jgi:nicotinamidase/pyrazinamidase